MYDNWDLKKIKYKNIQNLFYKRSVSTQLDFQKSMNINTNIKPGYPVHRNITLDEVFQYERGMWTQ